MAPIPPMLIRIATVFLTQVLTRRLQQSPMFFRAVDRLLHEIDHLPHRMQGKQIPQYRRINPQEPTLSERAQEAWNQQDHGEPHDLPNPFADPNAKVKDAPRIASSDVPPGQMSRDRARQSMEAAAQRNARQARNRRKMEDEQAKKDTKMDEMRFVLEKLRDSRQEPRP